MDFPLPSAIQLTVSYDLAVRLDAYQIMSELEGWCSLEKASVLIDLILREHPATIVEIGVFSGKSLIPMAVALRANGEGVIYGIDPWDPLESLKGMKSVLNRFFWEKINHPLRYERLLMKIEENDLEEQIVLIRSTSENAAPIQEIDLLHIDGNHSEEASYLDVTKWVPMVRSGGAIVFNDMTWSENGVYTTARAVAWLDYICEKVMEYPTDYSVWGIWRKR